MKTDLELRNLYAVRHRNLSTKRETVDVSHDLVLQLITEVLEHRQRDRDRLTLAQQQRFDNYKQSATLAIPHPFGQLRWLINNHFRVSLVSRGDKVERCRLVVENQQGTAQAISTDMNLEDVITPVFIQLSEGHHLQGGQ